MTTTNTTGPGTGSPPPQAVLSQMINGYWVTGSIHAAAKLGVAAAIGDAPRAIGEIAGAVGADTDSLYRLLRALAGLGIFVEGPGRTFAHTPLSLALRPGVPGSMHGLALGTGLLHLRAWPEITHAVKTGETAFRKVFGAEIFEYLATDAEASQAFDEAMAGYTAATSAAVVAAYDFSPFQKIVDIGGGNGALLAAILEKTPRASGVTFDLPQPSQRAKEALGARGLAGRCEVVAGDFFEGVPSGGDAYALKMIVHDWDDARSIAILKNVRKAIRPDGRVLIMESVVDPASGAGAPPKLLDINMLVMTGGRERTADEFAALYRASGFELARIVPANPMLSVIEGRPV
ncbi:MAG TPA: methyltransferase [Polyangia bacterium]|nr:methyltransferase [Polyangia bacterium]